MERRPAWLKRTTFLFRLLLILVTTGQEVIKGLTRETRALSRERGQCALFSDYGALYGIFSS